GPGAPFCLLGSLPPILRHVTREPPRHAEPDRRSERGNAETRSWIGVVAGNERVAARRSERTADAPEIDEAHARDRGRGVRRREHAGDETEVVPDACGEIGHLAAAPVVGLEEGARESGDEAAPERRRS